MAFDRETLETGLASGLDVPTALAVAQKDSGRLPGCSRSCVALIAGFIILVLLVYLL